MYIEGLVEKSVLFQGVTVKKGAMIRETVMMPDAVIGKNALIEKAIVLPILLVPEGVINSIPVRRNRIGYRRNLAKRACMIKT